VAGGEVRAGVTRALAVLVDVAGTGAASGGAERPSTLSPMRLSSTWMGRIVSIIRLKSCATSEGGFAGVGVGSGVGVRARAPESGSRNEETTTTSSESSTMALAAQWMDKLELLSLESKSMGRGGRSLDVSSAQSILDSSTRRAGTSSPAAGQGEGSRGEGSAGTPGAEDSMNQAMVAADSGAVGNLVASEVAIGAVIVRAGSARLGGLAFTG
jgi:hypothetical protein